MNATRSMADPDGGSNPSSLRPPSSLRLMVLMGVAGCGKSSVGTALAERLNIAFLDADDYHPAANVEKMSSGVPLTDEDRWPWLDRVAGALREHGERDGMALAGCSALRRVYRDRMIATAGAPILFLFLNGDRDLIARRMAARTDHFMPTGLLDSQLATLEPPQDDESALTVDIGPSVPALVTRILRQLALADTELKGNDQ